MERDAAESPLPWLALPDGTFYSFAGATAAFHFPDGSCYLGSCDDWLVFHRGHNGEYLLLNPFSRDTVQLPSLSSIRLVACVRVGSAGDVLLPGNDPRAPGYMAVRKMAVCSRLQVVAAIVGDERLGKVALCRPAPAAAFWSLSAHDWWRGLRDISFYDGKVYVVDEDEDLFAMDVVDDMYTREPKVSCVERRVKGAPVPAGRRDTAMQYLVVHGGRLLMVRRVIRSDTTSEFAVFKADFGSSLWAEVTSVGDDTALFVGRGGSTARCLSRYDLSRYALRGNRIYFLNDDEYFCLRSGDTGVRPRRRGYSDHFGAYDMKDGKTYPLLPPLTLCNRGEVPATWLFRRDQPGAPSWPELPVDVVGEVMSRLPTHDDRLRFITVCHEWRASGRQHWRPRQPSVAYLLLPIGTLFWFPEFRASRRLDDDSVNYCSAACDDWLLIEGDGSGLLRLMSPFTGRTRWLPALSRIRVDDEPIEVVNEPVPRGELRQWRDADKMTLWKLVVCPNGLIAAIIGREHFSKVALCSLESMTWKLNGHDRWRWYEDMAFSDGKLYALTNRDDLLAFDVRRDASSGEPAVSRVECVIKGSDGGGDRGIVKMRYLVRSCRGALLKVQRLILLPNTTVLFTVFKADLWSSPRRWVEASCLGGEALFVGRLCSRAVPASDAVRGDQIFFPTDDWAGMSFWTEHLGQPSHHAAVYDMKESNVSYLVPRQIWTDGWAPVTWLFPDAAEYQGLFASAH